MVGQRTVSAVRGRRAGGWRPRAPGAGVACGISRGGGTVCGSGACRAPRQPQPQLQRRGLSGRIGPIERLHRAGRGQGWIDRLPLWGRSLTFGSKGAFAWRPGPRDARRRPRPHAAGHWGPARRVGLTRFPILRLRKLCCKKVFVRPPPAGLQQAARRRRARGRARPAAGGRRAGTRGPRPHSRPKPSAFRMASRRRSATLSRLAYSGSSSVLKHVCAVGSLLESEPSRWMTTLSEPRPPMGALEAENGARSAGRRVAGREAAAGASPLCVDPARGPHSSARFDAPAGVTFPPTCRSPSGT
jgi:hypothetical protein